MNLEKRLQKIEKVVGDFPPRPSKKLTEEEWAAFRKMSTEEKIANIMTPKNEEQCKKQEELHKKLEKLSLQEKIYVAMGRMSI